jgi:hypothetical protein
MIYRKTILSLSMLIIACTITLGQNLQLHYDFGSADDGNADASRNYFTGTFEIFKPDNLGSLFMFMDVDFNKSDKGASLAYFEIARKFTLHKKSGFGVQVEYNDGTPDYINSAWLTGITYPVNIAGVELSTSLLYRINKGNSGPDFQFTTVWFEPLLQGKLLFSGFLDFWSQDNFAGNGTTWVLLSEPQLWFVLNKAFSIGTEIEISRNFFTFDGDVEVMPTAAIKLNL